MKAMEKYAEIGGYENRPLCDCHGKQQLWQAAADGGKWYCPTLRTERRKAAAPPPRNPALECLAEQYPQLSHDELIAELRRQRQLVRTGALAPQA